MHWPPHAWKLAVGHVFKFVAYYVWSPKNKRKKTIFKKCNIKMQFFKRLNKYESEKLFPLFFNSTKWIIRSVKYTISMICDNFITVVKQEILD